MSDLPCDSVGLDIGRPSVSAGLDLVGEFLAFVMVAGGFGTVMGAMVWLARRVRRRGVGGGLMGPLDEIYHPAAHRFRAEIQVAPTEGRLPATVDRRARPRPWPRGTYGADAVA